MNWGCMMDWCCMMSNMMYRSMMRVNMRWDWFSIFIQLWFWIVRVLVRVRIQFVQGNSLAAVHLVPKLTSKLVLIKQCTIRTDKSSSRGSIPAIIAHTVCLASCFWVCVHSGSVGNGGTAELGVGGFCVTWVVFAGNTGNSMLIVVWVMVLLVVGLWCMVWSWFMVSWCWRMVRCWFMVCGCWWMVRCWFMVYWCWRMVWFWFMVYWCGFVVCWGWWVIWLWLMVSWCWGMVWL